MVLHSLALQLSACSRSSAKAHEAGAAKCTRPFLPALMQAATCSAGRSLGHLLHQTLISQPSVIAALSLDAAALLVALLYLVS